MSENNTGVEGKYYPVSPIDPDKYTVQQYLFDTNTLLTEILRNQKLILEYLVAKAEEEQEKKKPKMRTIGIKE